MLPPEMRNYELEAEADRLCDEYDARYFALMRLWAEWAIEKTIESPPL